MSSKNKGGKRMPVTNLLMNSMIQVVLFTIIPFIWWFVFWRKKEPFLKWLGFKKINIKNKRRFAILFIVTMISLSLQILIIPYIINIEILAAYQFYQLGTKALIPAFIYAFIQTGLSEEIFFRGFLTKRLIHKYGFQIGNAFQSVLFGLIHGLMLRSNILGSVIIVLSTGIAAWLMGWINEKEANGSVLPSWLLHGYLNYASSIYMMFTFG